MFYFTFYCLFLQVNISRAGCSVSKVCFSEPANCDPTVSTDCFFMSAMMLSDSNTTIHYEMTGPSNGYISFGFSHDEIMVFCKILK